LRLSPPANAPDGPRLIHLARGGDAKAWVHVAAGLSFLRIYEQEEQKRPSGESFGIGNNE
jgi:hypothetical protein